MSQVFDQLDNPKIASLLSRGGVGVIKTDTIYGLVSSALNQQSVERVYKIRGRDKDKPSIILISKTGQIYDQSTDISISQYWPGKISIILPAPSAPHYLTRGGQTLAYRWPNEPSLIELIEKTGPLIAPSANPQGQPPAKNIFEAKKYFGDEVDFYVDSGEVKDAKPSRLMEFSESGEARWLR